MAGLSAVSTPKSVGCRCYPYRGFLGSRADYFSLFHSKHNVIIIVGFDLREGWQWKSSVEQSGAEIVAHSPTEFRTNVVITINVLNEGTPK
jgi:hypothetical protein